MPAHCRLSLRACRISRASQYRTARAAHSFTSSKSVLSDASSQAAAQAGASVLDGGKGRGRQKGSRRRFHDAFTFAPVQRVIQRVIPTFLSIEAPMEQLCLPLLCRLDAPSVVPHEYIKRIKDYRSAVRLCWQLRRVRNMTRSRLAEEAGLYAPHVTCYLNETPRARDLPGERIAAFQLACGNAAISQWLALQGRLTVLEEMQAQRHAA